MKKITLMMSALALFVSGSVSAQLLDENFEDQAADARWFAATIGDGTISPMDFAAKYSDLEVDAPANGGDYCAKMMANVLDADGEGNGQANFLGILPKADFSGEYTLTFDGYAYYDGESAGSTEAFMWGVGHAGDDPENEGYRLSVFGDNGSSRDVRLFKSGVEQKFDDQGAQFTYAGISQNGNLDAPDIAIYQTAYETEPTPDSHALNKWLSIKAEVTAEGVVYSINDVEFARFIGVPTDGSMMIAYVDLFTGSLNQTSYFLVDNVKVVAGALGINDNELSNVSVYPNPASGMVNVSVEGKANFQLFNILGQGVMNREINGTTSIDISSLNSGMYFSKITSESGATKTLKLQVK